MQRKQGFIKLLILIVIGLVVLGYFGYDVRDIIRKPQVQENLHYAWGLAKTGWFWLVNFVKGIFN